MDLEMALAKHGVFTSLLHAEPCRLDLFQNVPTDHACETYFPLLELLRPGRTQLISYPTTTLWKNKQWQFNIYDKIAEMKSRDASVEGLPPDVLRFEIGLLEKQKVRKELGILTVNQLLSDFDQLPIYFQRVLEEHLFSGELPDGPIIPGPSLQAKLETYKLNAGRNWLSKWWIHKGVEGVLREYPIEEIKEALSKVQGAHEPYQLTQRILEQRLFQERFETFQRTGIDLKDLYDELRGKLLGTSQGLRAA